MDRARAGIGPAMTAGDAEDDARPERGDEVTWRSHGSTVHGTVERELTSDTTAAGRTVRASKDDPQYVVRSEKTGREAVHKPSALEPEDSAGDRVRRPSRPDHR
jgi:hypothetical protein